MNENKWINHWTRDQIKSMLLEQSQGFWQRDIGIIRDRLVDLEQARDIPHAVIISGLRRVGKSTLLAQFAHKLGQDAFYYINFEDDRFLGFKAEDSSILQQLLVEIFGERHILLIDEIQHISGWEHFARRFMDMGYKLFITGSNASLLSRELGTLMTGRYFPIELFPFSFREYMHFYRVSIPDLQRMTTIDRGLLNSKLNHYLREGGIPDALKYPKLGLLRTLYEDILFRDIASRYRLDAITALKELGFYVLSNPASLVSFNKLKTHLHLGSVNTVKSYIDYLENSWMIFSINLYDFSIKRQQIAPKKIYCIDNGLLNTIGFNFSQNTGKLLENLVFLSLRQTAREIYYYVTPAGFEVDFYIPEKNQLIQVSQNINDPTVRERETRAMSDAITVLKKIDHALILTGENERSSKVGKKTIEIRSISEWLISR